MFTEEGINTWKEAKEFGLADWYDEYMGNFGFTENDLFENMNKILMWLENHKDYVLMYEYCKAYEGRNWWLSPQELLM